MPRNKIDQMYIQKLLRALGGHWLYRLRWRDRYYLTKERALNVLKSETGQDFGYDVKAWRKWFDENPDFQFKGLLGVRGNTQK